MLGKIFHGKIQNVLVALCCLQLWVLKQWQLKKWNLIVPELKKYLQVQGIGVANKRCEDL